MVKIKKKLTSKHLKKPKTNKVKNIKKSKLKDDSSSMSVDQFLSQDFEHSDSEDSDQMDERKTISESDVEENESGDEFEKHKKDLAKLQNTDPDFYQFLQENDKKLLEFNLSDAELSDDNDCQEDNTTHELPQKLEVASDESDFEDDGQIKDRGVITLNLLKIWDADIQKDTTNKTISTVIEAFHAALLRVSGEVEDNPSPFKVEGSAVFNAVVQLCVIHLGPALRRFLGLGDGTKKPPHKCKRFVKVKNILKQYLIDLTKLLSHVTSPNIQIVMLKHLHYILPFLNSYPNITKSILKRLISLWGTADEGVRVLAFLCILRVTNNQKTKYLDVVLKSMYMTYVKNSKFVSVGSLASINFMRRSLVEMFALDATVAYQHVFLYIRQLAIHLRNAITVNKKENIQAVYNWQYVNSLRLWGNLLSSAGPKSQLQQLVYPFVQVCLGAIKLVPTTQYFPLRFHLIQILIDLSGDTGVFIPVLPFVLEVLSGYDFNKKHQKVSMKPLQFTCVLRVSKSQMIENGFKDALIENVYGLLLEYLASQAHSISFPDLGLLSIVQIKQFLKKCANVNYNRKMKQLMEKIEQNAHFVEKERSKISFNIVDFKQIEGWESQIKTKGTPLGTFFDNWNKLRVVKKNKLLTNNEELADYKLPTIKKKAMKKVVKEGPVELFPDDSDDSNEEVSEQNKRKRGKRGGKNVNKKARRQEAVHVDVEDDGRQDIIEDLNVDDWYR